MPKLPKGITQDDIERYIKIKKQLDKVLPIYQELEGRIKQSYRDANTDLDKKKTIVVMEGPLVVTLTPSTSMNSARFIEDHPSDVEEYKQYYKESPDVSVISKDDELKAEYWEKATTSVSLAVSQ